MLGAVVGLLAVAMSAVAAHMPMEPAANAMLRDAVQMQGWHALALLFTGLFAAGRLGRLAGLAFIVGIVGFCGPIYALVFFGLKATFIAPYGGTALMFGWALLAVTALRHK